MRHVSECDVSLIKSSQTIESFVPSIVHGCVISYAYTAQTWMSWFGLHFLIFQITGLNVNVCAMGVMRIFADYKYKSIHTCPKYKMSLGSERIIFQIDWLTNKQSSRRQTQFARVWADSISIYWIRRCYATNSVPPIIDLKFVIRWLHGNSIRHVLYSTTHGGSRILFCSEEKITNKCVWLSFVIKCCF